MDGRYLLGTFWKLGFSNCVRVGAYRLQTRMGAYQVSTPVQVLPRIGALLRDAKPIPFRCQIRNSREVISKAERIVAGEMELFGHHWLNVGSPPNWFCDPWTRQSWGEANTHWSSTREFAAPGFDIKAIWEQSRFEWAVVLSRAFSLTGRNEFLHTLCSWLDSWIESNPSNAGPNWKCGQEASIRLLRFLETLQSIAWEPIALAAIQAFVLAHVRRIEATLSYAIGQDNNHGTSEAAAMFVGGCWLLSNAVGNESKFAARVAQRGQRQLVERIVRLVSSDGSFSQHSVNYHRMLLDTIAIAEVWRRRLGISPFFDQCADRVEAAVDWLSAMVEPGTGDAPNLGANDGTVLLISPATAFRDHRPTLQFISCLTQGTRLYAAGAWDDASRYWGIEPEDCPLVPSERRSRVFMPGGFVSLVGEQRSWGLFRVPSYRFRPSHADALHLDLWVDGENVIRDTGTYSYNATGQWYEYFSGTRGHSTCEFDNHDQMPRLGRFLFSRWLSCDDFRLSDPSDPGRGAMAAYMDYSGARHQRSIEVRGSRWIIQDQVGGRYERAVIRWHLAPDRWALSGSQLAGSRVLIEVDGAGSFQLRLVEGWESRAYMDRTPIPVLEVELQPDCGTLQTTITMLQ